MTVALRFKIQESMLPRVGLRYKFEESMLPIIVWAVALKAF